jgi:hypothetical protein
MVSKLWWNWCNTFDSVKHIPASDIHISLYIISLIQICFVVSEKKMKMWNFHRVQC